MIDRFRNENINVMQSSLWLFKLPNRQPEARLLYVPRLQLVPSAALAIAIAIVIVMELHELCTNATKYGALSTPNGHVEIIWELQTEGDGRRLSLRWTESGPPVAAPTRKGFARNDRTGVGAGT